MDDNKQVTPIEAFELETDEKTGKVTLVKLLDTSLSGIVIPDNINIIGDWAFEDCVSLKSVVIPSSVTLIDDYAFSGCSNLNSVIIPSSVKTIGDSAFDSCSSLTNIDFPTSVTTIGDSAFEDCSGLTNIVIPSSVIKIGSSAFSGCSKLTDIVIPSSVTSIEEETFSWCDGLKSVVIPSSVTSIGESAFEECKSLAHIEIPSSVTKIGRGAFSSCNGLTEIIIPPSVTAIEDETFSWCDGLKYITIPTSVTFIGNDAFADCDNIEAIIYPGSKEQWEKIVIKDEFLRCVEINLESEIKATESTKPITTPVTNTTPSQLSDNATNVYNTLSNEQKAEYIKQEDMLSKGAYISGIIISVIMAMAAIGFSIWAFVAKEYGALTATGLCLFLLVASILTTITAKKELSFTDEVKIKNHIERLETQRQTNQQKYESNHMTIGSSYHISGGATGTAHYFSADKTRTDSSDGFPWLSGKSDHLSFDEIIDIEELLDD